MKKSHLFALALLAAAFSLSGCPSPGGGVDPTGAVVYAAGSCYDNANVQVPGYWKNGSWVELPRLGPYPGAVVALAVSGKDIYAGGWCWSGTGSDTQISGVWKNGAWSGWGSQSITSLVVAGNETHAGGKYRLSGVDAPCLWDNGSWSSLPVECNYGSSVSSIALLGNDVYAGGHRAHIIDTAPVVYNQSPGYWINGAWNPLPDCGYGGRVNALVESGGTIYAAGFCVMPSSPMDPQTALCSAGYWQSGAWIPLTTATPGVAQAKSIAVSASDVVLCGYNGSIPGYWKNGSWTALPPQAAVSSVAIDGGDVYVGGSSDSSTSAQPGYWKNGTWIGLTLPGGTKGGQVISVVVGR